jgi:hypothetical protein
MARIDPLYNKRSGIKGKGAFDLQVKDRKTRIYDCTDTIVKASKPYICDCCGERIIVGNLYVRRNKKFYTDHPIMYQKFKLCLSCADKA